MTSRRLSLSLALALLVSAAVAQDNTPPADYSGPARIDLSGTWDFRLDPTHAGEAAHWYATDDAEDKAAWTKLAVPGSFNEQLAKHAGTPDPSDTMRFVKATGWYRTAFASPTTTPGGHCFLHLSGTVLRHAVWLNGQLVGRGNRPYLEESYDITPLLRASGPNTLVIAVDNTIPAHGIPDRGWRGWWDDGGLIRPVYLELRPRSYGESHATTTMAEDGAWRLDLSTTVYRAGTAKAVSVAYELADATGRVVWSQKPAKAPADEAHASALLPKMQSWSPDHPALYSLTTTLADGGQTDRTRVRIGFRQIETRGSQILLNGQPFQVRGVTRHQFLAGAGMSLTVAQDRRDIEDIKNLGANFVRLAHYTQSQDVFDACDELGLLVWTEIPAWQSGKESLGDPTVWQTDAEPQLRGMVLQHWNHPSVGFWSVGNEIPSETPTVAAYVAKAIAYVKTLDRTRLITFASDRRQGDKSFGPVDVIALNEYFGWYYGKLDDVGSMLDSMHTLYPDKPLIVSEFGSEAVAGWDPATAPAGSRDYSYAAQATFLKSHLEQIYAPERRGFVAGGIIWVYNDFPDPHRVGGDHPVAASYRNNKGLVTMDRTRKPSYDVVRNFFQAQRKGLAAR